MLDGLYSCAEPLTQQSCSNRLLVCRKREAGHVGMFACEGFQSGCDCASSDCGWGLGSVNDLTEGEGGGNMCTNVGTGLTYHANFCSCT